MFNWLNNAPWRCMGSLRITTSSRRWMFSFTLRPLSPKKNNTLYSLDRRLLGSQNKSGHLTLLGHELEPSVIQRVASHYADWATTIQYFDVPHSELLAASLNKLQCVPLAGSPGKCWFTKITKVQYICIHTCNEVRLCVLGIRKKEVGNTKR
jgi:hypothetical protein